MDKKYYLYYYHHMANAWKIDSITSQASECDSQLEVNKGRWSEVSKESYDDFDKSRLWVCVYSEKGVKDIYNHYVNFDVELNASLPKQYKPVLDISVRNDPTEFGALYQRECKLHPTSCSAEDIFKRYIDKAKKDDSLRYTFFTLVETPYNGIYSDLNTAQRAIDNNLNIVYHKILNAIVWAEKLSYKDIMCKLNSTTIMTYEEVVEKLKFVIWGQMTKIREEVWHSFHSEDGYIGCHYHTKLILDELLEINPNVRYFYQKFYNFILHILSNELMELS